MMRKLMLALWLVWMGPAALAATGLDALGITDTPAAEDDDLSFLPASEAYRFVSSQDGNTLILHWTIADGYYLYQERFSLTPLNGAPEPGPMVFSRDGDPKDDPYFGRVRVFHDEVGIRVPITANAPAEYRVAWQGCAEAGLCYPPQKQTVLFVPAGDTASTATGNPSATQTPAGNTDPASDAAANERVTPVSSAASLSEINTESASDLASLLRGQAGWVTLAIFLVLGIGLAFTPCVFPMIPILSSIVTGSGHISTQRALVLSLGYVLGMAATYALAGVLVGIFGASANIQAYMQEPWLIGLFALLFVLLALSMFGFYELQLPAFIRDRLASKTQNARGGSLPGATVMGVFSALVVSPCVSAPLAGALVYISTTGDGLLGGAALFTLGLGMGIPLIIIAVGGKRFLPRAGGWMESVKAVFGVLLLGVAVWLLERILPAPVTLGLWALLAICSAVYMGAFGTPQSGWQKLWKGIGLALFVYGLMLLTGAALHAEDPLRPLAPLTRTVAVAGGTTVPATQPKFRRVTSIDELETALQDARARNQPVFVDFYADWCISCKVVEREVFTDPEVAGLMGRVALIKADITENDEANQALLNRFGLYGPPAYLFYDQTGRQRADLNWIGEIDAPNLKRILSDLLSAES
ncbi:protein-disulfide reductase DsbD [Hahella sp. SMD15-11]|uniref:Thiol:disulfide interchange protein DsbD n=1 Tax=Thermohahella caldifontis TaxID=3142973 RepID=A0AB39UZI0_9GAMM